MPIRPLFASSVFAGIDLDDSDEPVSVPDLAAKAGGQLGDQLERMLVVLGDDRYGREPARS